MKRSRDLRIVRRLEKLRKKGIKHLVIVHQGPRAEPSPVGFCCHVEHLVNDLFLAAEVEYDIVKDLDEAMKMIEKGVVDVLLLFDKEVVKGSMLAKAEKIKKDHPEIRVVVLITDGLHPDDRVVLAERKWASNDNVLKDIVLGPCQRREWPRIRG